LPKEKLEEIIEPLVEQGILKRSTLDASGDRITFSGAYASVAHVAFEREYHDVIKDAETVTETAKTSLVQKLWNSTIPEKRGWGHLVRVKCDISAMPFSVKFANGQVLTCVVPVHLCFHRDGRPLQDNEPPRSAAEAMPGLVQVHIVPRDTEGKEFSMNMNNEAGDYQIVSLRDIEHLLVE
jgi:hypothetical protein